MPDEDAAPETPVEEDVAPRTDAGPGRSDVFAEPAAAPAGLARAAKPRKKEHVQRYETLLLATLGAGLLGVLAGSVVATVDDPELYRLGLWVSVLGVVLSTAATWLSFPLKTLRHYGRKTTGGTRYDQLRYWTRVKTASVTLNMLLVVSGVLLTLSLFHRIDPVALEAGYPLAFRAAVLLNLAVAVNIAVAHLLALRTAPKREPGGFHGLFLALCAAGMGGFALLAAVLATRPLEVLGTRLQVTDAPFFLLAAGLFAGVSAFVARSLPTLVVLLIGDRDAHGSAGYLSRRKSVMLPIALAFALLCVVVLVLLVFGVGLVGLAQDVPRNAVLIGVFGFIIVALVASVAVSLYLSKGEDTGALFRPRRSAESTRGLILLGVSGAASVVLFGIALALGLGASVAGLGPEKWLDFLTFGLLSALGPYGFYIAGRHRRVRKLEERFPDFLRDLAASRKAGLTLSASVAIASRGEYGDLTPEVVKMADQLSWNVPFEEALAQFAQRVKTPLVQRTVSLINEASRSGGNVTDVLLAVARDAREIKNLETERRTSIGLYTGIIYITFFVFLTVAAVLYGTFVPVVVKTATATAHLAHGSSVAGLGLSGLGLGDYRQFYFLAALVQGLGNGFVAGMMASGKYLDGLRHSFLMVLITYATFAFLLPGA